MKRTYTEVSSGRMSLQSFAGFVASVLTWELSQW